MRSDQGGMGCAEVINSDARHYLEEISQSVKHLEVRSV